jgi:hypothetical protein
VIIPTKEVPRALVKAFGIRKRTCLLYLRTGPSPTVNIVGTEWGGGSRSYYQAVNLTTASRCLLVSPVYPLEPGQCVVETGYFQGRPATPIFFVREDDLDLWLGLEDVPRGMPGPILMDWLLEQERADEADRVRALLEGCRLLNT